MSRAEQEANAELRDGDLEALDPRWLPVIRQCRQQMNAAGIGTPAGMEDGGEMWMRHYMISSTGLVKWMIYYRVNKSICQLLGFFVTAWLPDDRGRPKPGCRKRLKTHGKMVMVNHKVTGQLERRIKVLLDSDGMPVPVPEPLWRQYGLE